MIGSIRIAILQRATQPLRDVSARLRGWGCSCEDCGDVEQVLAAMAEGRADVVLVDAEIGDAIGSIVQRRREIAARAIPVVAASSKDPAAGAAHALALGADDIVFLPLDDCELQARLRVLARLAAMAIERDRRRTVLVEFGGAPVEAARQGQAGRAGILLIGPAGADQIQVMSALGGATTAAYAETAAAAVERLQRGDIDVALITEGHRMRDAADICAAVRAEPALFDLPLILIGHPHRLADRALPFHWGASDVLLQPLHPELLRLRVQSWVRQQRLRRQLRGQGEDAFVPLALDRLARLYDHGFLHAYLDHLLQRDRSPPRQLTVAGFAITELRQINQRFGYATGNRLLAHVGALLARTCRAEDLPARHGGGRFCIVFKETSAADALLACERIATIVAQTPLLGDGPPLPVELAAGVAELQAGDDPAALTARAFAELRRHPLRQAS